MRELDYLARAVERAWLFEFAAGRPTDRRRPPLAHTHERIAAHREIKALAMQRPVELESPMADFRIRTALFTPSSLTPVAHTPRTARASPPVSARKSIPLDPTAEAALLQREYEESRLARLKAVRAASNEEAAAKRAHFQKVQRARSEKEKAQAVALAAQDEAEKRAQLQQQYAEAQRSFGEAQRASAAFTENRLQTAAAAAVRRQSLDENAQQRFQSALSRVHQQHEAVQSKRQQAADIKERIKQAQQENRAQLERQEKALAERAPAHLLAWSKMSSPARTDARQQTQRTPDPAQATVRIERYGNTTPHFPRHAVYPSTVDSAPHFLTHMRISADEEDELLEAPRPLPTPHPHPSARKHQPPPATPASSIAVVLDFDTPAHASDREEKESTLHSHEASASISASPSQHNRVTPTRTQLRDLSPPHHPSPRPHSALTRFGAKHSQPKSFELVTKEAGRIVRHDIRDEPPATKEPEHPSHVDPPVHATDRPSTHASLRLNHRQAASSARPCRRVANTAFFQNARRCTSADNKQAERPSTKKPVAWIVETTSDQHHSTTGDDQITPSDFCESAPIADAPVVEQLKPAPLSPTSAPADPVNHPVLQESSSLTPAHSHPSEANDVPVDASALDSASKATAPAPITSASHPLYTPHVAHSDPSDRLSAALPASFATSNVVRPTLTPEHHSGASLDQQLRQILQRHVMDEEKLVAQTHSHVAQPTFDARTKTPRASRSDDSSDDEEEVVHASNFQSPSSSHAMWSFTTPASASAATPSSAAYSSRDVTPMTPAEMMLSQPTAATDLFIESIQYLIDQEQLASAEADREISEAAHHTAQMQQHAQQVQLAMQQSSSSAPTTMHAVTLPQTHLSQIVEEEDALYEGRATIQAASPPTIFSSPTTRVAADTFSSPSLPHYLQTPTQHRFASPSSQSPPMSADRHALAAAFRHLSDADFHKAHPIHVVEVPTPTISAAATPMRWVTPTRHDRTYTPSAKSHPFATPPTRSHQTMQQRFEERMAL